MPLAYWCILVAALLPLLLAKYAKAGSGSDNRYPREDYDVLTPPKRRAYAAHQNASENFPFFAVAVVIALTLGAPTAILNLLAVAYIVVRIVYSALYIYNKPQLRSAAFVAGFALNIAIFLLPAFR